MCSEPLPHTAYFPSLSRLSREMQNNKEAEGGTLSPQLSQKAEVAEQKQTLHPKGTGYMPASSLTLCPGPLFATTPAVVRARDQTKSGSSVSCRNCAGAQTAPAELLSSQHWSHLCGYQGCQQCPAGCSWTFSAQFLCSALSL